MNNGDKSLNVTRREFYGALAIIWLYIMIVISDLLRIEWRWSTGILWLTSLLMAIACTASALRADTNRGAGANNAAPLSERVKEIARDPARKIEAIKIYRDETGAGLAEAKEAVEAYINGAFTEPTR